jgi:hypothetical protein
MLIGGWAPEEHSQFLMLREHLFKEGARMGHGSKMGRESTFMRMVQLLPGHSLQDVLQHDDWHVASTLFQRRRRDIVEAWNRERRQFLEDSECFLQESAELNQAQAIAAAERCGWCNFHTLQC